jgi:hypothetical protein
LPGCQPRAKIKDAGNGLHKKYRGIMNLTLQIKNLIIIYKNITKNKKFYFTFNIETNFQEHIFIL